MIIYKEDILESLAIYSRRLGEEGNASALVALLIKNLEAEHFQSCLDNESRRKAAYRAILSLNKNLAEA